MNKHELAETLLGSQNSNVYQEPKKEYTVLKATPEYIDTLPDLQNGDNKLPQVPIQHVGINNFRLPLKYDVKDGGLIELETSVTGTVSLEAQNRGINMSRILRGFYEFKNEFFNIDLVEKILSTYKQKLGTFDARIIMNFSYPIIRKSLRSGMEGYQYYDVSFEVDSNKDGSIKKVIHLDYVYSSACPCSFELSEHARKYRGIAGISHSQRSKTRVSIEMTDSIWIEDIVDILTNALKTETQVMVKREDEQAFAELNAAYQKFVEDAARLIYVELNKNASIKDFKVVCSHLESLHSHNAISVITKNVPGGFDSDVSVAEWKSLTC